MSSFGTSETTNPFQYLIRCLCMYAVVTMSLHVASTICKGIIYRRLWCNSYQAIRKFNMVRIYFVAQYIHNEISCVQPSDDKWQQSNGFTTCVRHNTVMSYEVCWNPYVHSSVNGNCIGNKSSDYKQCTVMLQRTVLTIMFTGKWGRIIRYISVIIAAKLLREYL